MELYNTDYDTIYQLLEMMHMQKKFEKEESEKLKRKRK